MDHDLVIRNGTVVDGSGLGSYRADVGISGATITTVGRIRERGRREIDADGQVVTPGFVDGHTHLDAQLFWDPMAGSSCWQGVTTVVMGNCGFTLAPAKSEERALVEMEVAAMAHVAVVDPTLPIPRGVTPADTGVIAVVTDDLDRACLARLITTVPGDGLEGQVITEELAEQVAPGQQPRAGCAAAVH